MKTKIVLPLFLFTVMFVITGCPYKSKVPIDEANVKIKENLLGKWVEKSNLNEDKPNFFQISKMDDFKYVVVNNEYSSYDSTYTQTNYIAHLSIIDDLSFLNMQHDSDYHLHRIDFSDREFTLYEITDNIDEEFSDSDELKAFITKYLHLSFFYNKDEKKYAKLE